MSNKCSYPNCANEATSGSCFIPESVLPFDAPMTKELADKYMVYSCDEHSVGKHLEDWNKANPNKQNMSDAQAKTELKAYLDSKAHTLNMPKEI